MEHQKMVQERSKGKVSLDKGFGIEEDSKRAVDVPYLIDTNKRKKLGQEPKMTE
jgi:hypothetical protein